jgi:hypothetical protein
MLDVKAVIVTMAAISNTDRSLVTNMGTLVSQLKDSGFTSPSKPSPAAPPILPATAWQAALNSGTFTTTAGVPARVAQEIRVYQHFFFLSKY